MIIEVDDGKFYRKALYLMVKTMVSCKFSLKPIQWHDRNSLEIRCGESRQPTRSPPSNSAASSSVRRATTTTACERWLGWMTLMTLEVWDVLWNHEKMDICWLGFVLEHGWIICPCIGKNHPNWRTHIFQRGWNHRPVCVCVMIDLIWFDLTWLDR